MRAFTLRRDASAIPIAVQDWWHCSCTACVICPTELRIHSLRMIFMKSSTFRFMDALLILRCCSMLMPVKKVKIISASSAGFILGSRSQHQLAASVAQFELSERVAHVVEGEDSGNRHFQLAPCNEVSQFGDHCCGCGIRAAF